MKPSFEANRLYIAGILHILPAVHTRNKHENFDSPHGHGYSQKKAKINNIFPDWSLHC